MDLLHLTQEHAEAVNRRRRIIVQYDLIGNDPKLFGIDIEQLIKTTFHFADEPGSQIDTIIWDIDYFMPKDENAGNPGLKKWLDEGIDVIRILLEEAKKRGLENIWNHRISEVDFGPAGTGLGLTEKNKVKREHPDWVVRSWWWQGLWNLASPGLREYKLDYLRRLLQYDALDGIQIDFARHVPCLPPGSQWEHREHATEFVRMVRRMLLEHEGQRGRAMLMSAKVPESPEGCRVDGFDVETWARQRLVDMFTLGSRTINVDLSSFRGMTEGRNIKLHPCLDDHHATDGYQFPPIEFFRGVFGNWRQQGADGVVTFNWAGATDEVYAQCGIEHPLRGPVSHRLAYREVGSLTTLKFKDKMFAVERRGGYPWAEGYFNRNDGALLPAILRNDGSPLALPVHVCDDLGGSREVIEKLYMRLVLFGAKAGDRFEISLNGVTAEIESYDSEWKDMQIFSPKPQPPSGGAGRYKVNPEQRLLMVSIPLTPGLFKLGKNMAGIRVVDRAPFPPGDCIVAEKLEVWVHYKAAGGNDE